MQGLVEGTMVVMGFPSWQEIVIVFSIVCTPFAGMTVAWLGIMRTMTGSLRSIDTRITEHYRSSEATIGHGTEEHRVWQQEMKEIDDKLTEVAINAEVERRLRDRQ